MAVHGLQYGRHASQSVRARSSPYRCRTPEAALYFATCLKIGAMFACFQSLGMLPVFSEWWNIAVRIGAMTSVSSLSTLGLIPSGPDPL